jgi:hypothetical protein
MTEEEYLLYEEQQQQRAYEAANGVTQEEEEEPQPTPTPQPTPEASVTPPEQPVAPSKPTESTNTPEQQLNPIQEFAQNVQGVIEDPVGAVKNVQDAVASVTNPEIKDPNAALASDLASQIPTAIAQGPTGVITKAFQDLGMDAIGNIPGLGWVDDQYDKNTRFQNPTLQNIREKLSLLVPAGLAGVGATQATGGLAAPAVLKGLASMGLSVAADATITAVSDQSETENNTLRDLDDMFPQLNIPDRFKTLDGDSPEVRTEKHIYDSIGLSLAGEFLGFALQAGKPIMKWFNPLNKNAEIYKAGQLSTVMDRETASAISAIDEQISLGAVDPKQLDALTFKRNELIQQVETRGSSEATSSPLEAAVQRADDSRQVQMDEDGIAALKEEAELDTRGKGVFYHGAASEIKQLDDQHYSGQNIYGEGFYTTDDLSTAASYQKKNRKYAGDNAQDTIYKTNVNEDVTLFDLDSDILPDLKDELEYLTEYSEAASIALDQLDSGEIKTLAQFMDTMRGYSRETGESANTITEQFETIKEILGKRGFGGYTHKGGMKAGKGKRPHQVNIYWDAANQVQLEQVAKQQFDFNPNVTSSITNEMNVPRTAIPPGNVARNMADVAAIKSGISGSTGTPAPVLTSPMIRKGIGVNGTTRNVVKALAEDTRSTGNFAAVVDGVRLSKREINAAAWKVYQDIILSDSMVDLRQLFASRRDIKNVLDGQIDYVNEVQAMGIGFAMRDLVNTYLGREVTESSARVMDTLGREVMAQTKALVDFGSAANKEAVMDTVFDKLNFLMDEYATNKYISGWQLQNKKWWEGRFGNQAGEMLEMTTKQFDAAIKKKKGMNKALTQQIKQLAKENPEMADALVDAYAMTNGDVDTLVKLNKYVGAHLNPFSAIVTPRGMDKMTSIASGLWAVKFNNILSGLSAVRTGVGATVLNTLKATNAITGSGLESLVTRDPAALRESLYIYGAWAETNKRALKYGWSQWKRAIADPNFAQDATRADFVFESEKNLEIIDAVAKTWDDNQYGKKFLYNWNKNNHKISKSPYMRWGTNAMIGVDGFTKSTQATLQSRAEIYLKAAKKGVNVKNFRDAEKANYSRMFDAEGRLTNKAAENAAGEINMNLDDGISSIISSGTTQVPVLRSLFTFPKTGMNALKMASSYTPLMAIPGMNKYTKLLWAGKDLDKIKIALKEHDVDFDTTPNAMQIYNNLRREYIGRQASAATFVSVGMAYGLAGNVRGPGHHDPSRRQKERDNLGYIPYTVKIPGTDIWFDYRGLGEPVASLLTVIGSSSYYLGEIDEPVMQDIQDKLSWTVTAAYTNQSFVSQLEPLAGLLYGDETAINRFAANEVRSFIPQSGALGVMANAISSTQKDIHNNLLDYVMARLPGANTTLPERIDYWTGDALNDINNPLLRAINALNPLKVSEGVEPWRQELLAIGYDGLSLVSKDTSGTLEYPADVRELIYSRMGKTQPWKEAKRILGMEKYQNEIRKIKVARQEGMTTQQIRSQDTELFSRLDAVVRDSLKVAEASVLKENEYVRQYIEMGKRSRTYVEQGRTEEATRLQKQMEPLLQMIK